MRDRKPILLIIISVIQIIACSCSREVFQSTWHEKDITQEKETGVLETPLRFFDSKSRLQYTVLNDKENLYICMKAMEDQAQRKLMHSGLQLWIDTAGRGKKHINLSYPIPSEDSNNGEGLSINEKGSRDKKTIQNHFLLAHPDMMLTGFHLPINGLVPLQNKFGIALTIHWDSTGTLVYKARIPFRTFYHTVLSGKDVDKIMSIRFFIPALAGSGAPSGNVSRNRNGNRGSMASGGMNGGNRGGIGSMQAGRRSGGRTVGKSEFIQSSNLNSETDITLYFKLAVNPDIDKNN